mgnify:CR=1 FL=1
MEYWNSTLTEKSWKIMQDLKGFRYVLIGGWAAYLWTRVHKSKDIDIVLPDISELEHLKNNYELKKNDHLKKYEIQIEEIDIDIYVPYFSKLSIPVNDIPKHTASVQGITVVLPEVLLILKQGAEEQREHSVKGEKDRVDIMTLLCFAGINMNRYYDLTRQYGLEDYPDRIRRIIRSFNEIRYIDLTPRQMKLKKKELLSALRF